MSHERSVTNKNEDNGTWSNYYGPGTSLAGQPIPAQQMFEKPSYDTVGEAEAAAQLRSGLHGLSHGSELLPSGPTPPPSGIMPRLRDLSHWLQGAPETAGPPAPPRSPNDPLSDPSVATLKMLYDQAMKYGPGANKQIHGAVDRYFERRRPK